MQETLPRPQVILGLILLGMVLAGVAAFLAAAYIPGIQLHVGELFLIAPALIYLLRRKYPLKSALRINHVDKRVLRASAGLGLSFTILTDELDRLISTFYKMPAEFEIFIFQILIIDSWLEGILLFLAAVVFAGVIEEMLFRGLLQRALEMTLTAGRAIFFSALVFALVHLNPWWLIQILLLGMMLGLLAWRCNSIIPGILVHSINNGLALLMLNIKPERLRWYEWQGHVNPLIVLIAAGAAYYGLKSFIRLTKGAAVPRDPGAQNQ